MSTKLSDHLYPKGKSSLEPDVMPNVLDSDSNPIDYYGPNRKTNESTVVNLGNAPNSNDGDPLRTAFGKINNFIEAAYWVNESINQNLNYLNKKVEDHDSDLTVVLTLIDPIDGGTY